MPSVSTEVRNSAIGSACTTPGADATLAASASGNTFVLVNGPETPTGTTQASTPKASTTRVISFWKLALTPLMRSVSAKTRPAAATPIMNRRSRHWRSRKLTNSTEAETTHTFAHLCE